MFKIDIKKICLALSVFLLLVSPLQAAFLSNGFLVTSGFYDLLVKDNHQKQCVDVSEAEDLCVCRIKIFYPKITSSNKTIIDKINQTIYDFVLSFNSCEKNGLIPIQKIINYQFPDSGYQDYFSIKFMKKEEMKTQKQYSFTFNKVTGNLVDFSDIFIESNEFKEFLLNNFNKFLPRKNNNQEFFNIIEEKIASQKLQFYIETGLFHIVINNKPNDKATRVIDIVVPKNFIKIKYAQS
jgi:hypothetical protein